MEESVSEVIWFRACFKHALGKETKGAKRDDT